MARREQPPQEQLAGTGEAGRGRSKRRGRALKVLVLGGVVAFVAKPSVRSRVLDVLFGPEEQFDYESPTEPVAPDLRSEESQAGWPPPASEPPAAVGEAEEHEPGAWRFSQHTEWTAESSAVLGASAEEEETGEHSEVDEDFGREGTFGGDSPPAPQEPPPYQAGPSAEVPSSIESAGYGVADPAPEPGPYGVAEPNDEPAGYGGSAPEPAGYGVAEPNDEPAVYGEPEPPSPWPPPAASDPHDSDGAPASEPPASAPPPPEGEGPAIGEATPRSEADAPRGGWWLSRLRKDTDPAPEPPRWD
jgi:hypothetical protein